MGMNRRISKNSNTMLKMVMNILNLVEIGRNLSLFIASFMPIVMNLFTLVIPLNNRLFLAKTILVISNNPKSNTHFLEICWG